MFIGIVAISTNTLRILALEKLGAVFNQVSFPLEYTPRKFVIHPDKQNLIVLETEHNAYTEETKKQRRLQMAEEMKEAAGEEEQELAKEMADAFLNEDLPESMFSSPKAGHGMWASTLRIMNPVSVSNHLKLYVYKKYNWTIVASNCVFTVIIALLACPKKIISYFQLLCS